MVRVGFSADKRRRDVPSPMIVSKSGYVDRKVLLRIAGDAARETRLPSIDRNEGPVALIAIWKIDSGPTRIGQMEELCGRLSIQSRPDRTHDETIRMIVEDYSSVIDVSARIQRGIERKERQKAQGVRRRLEVTKIVHSDRAIGRGDQSAIPNRDGAIWWQLVRVRLVLGQPLAHVRLVANQDKLDLSTGMRIERDEHEWHGGQWPRSLSRDRQQSAPHPRRWPSARGAIRTRIASATGGEGITWNAMSASSTGIST